MILALLLAFQSGTVTIPAALTNNVADISGLLPPPNPGMVALRITAHTSFDQACAVTSTHPDHFLTRAIFCNRAELMQGDFLAARAERRASTTFDCDFGTWTGTLRSDLSVSALFPAQPLQPILLRSSVRSAVTVPWLVGQGSVTIQTTSASASVVEYEYLP